MLKNYFIIAYRHLKNHKLFASINILCLAIGITFSMLTLIYVLHEKSVNTTLKNAGNQYVIKSNWKVKGTGLDITTLGPLAKTMRDEYPNLVANYYRFNPVTNVVSAGDKYFKEDIAICDTTLVSMFGFPLLYGNKEKAFTNNNAALVTEKMALKLFGQKDVINKTISIQTTLNGERQDYLITGVLKDMPYNSVTDFLGARYNVYIPTIGNRYYQGGDPAQSWAGWFEVGMIELQPGVKPADLVKPFKQVLAKYTDDNIKANLVPELAPLKDYYLKNNNGAALKMIITLSLVAFFILFMAVINFININIGTSAYRLKEIGLRKVFGGRKTQLVIQYLTEACLLTFIAGVISVGLYQLLRPVFSQLLNTQLQPVWHFNAFTILLLILLLIVTALIAGIYPAFVLSASNIIHAVKGKIDSSKGALRLRKTLLVIQFTLAIIVFISAFTISKQVSYVFNKDLGYNKEQLMVITAFPKQWDSAGVIKMESIKKSLLQLPVVKSASIAFEVPDRKPPNNFSLIPPGKNNTEAIQVATFTADEDYAQTYGLHVEFGSFFTHGGGYIPGEIVLNETAAKALGLTPSQARGKILKLQGTTFSFTVAGVVKDYHYSSMQENIEPLAFVHLKDNLAYRYLTVKLNSSNIQQCIEEIKSRLKQLTPNAPFEYSFMDDNFQSLYQSELQLKKAANIATILNFIIVLMGIFGIVAFTLTRRTKEIAMRKVLGASVKNIILLFIKDYAWLIFSANIIAWPLAYMINNQWLQNYAYRVQQDVIPYLSAALFIFITSFFLIALQCFKVASAKPVISLKTE